ncbi:hypothetical protein [Staphylococcus caprae]
MATAIMIFLFVYSIVITLMYFKKDKKLKQNKKSQSLNSNF